MKKLPFWMKTDDNSMFGDDSLTSSIARDAGPKSSFPGPAEAVQSGSQFLHRDSLCVSCISLYLSVLSIRWLFFLPSG